ncbi:MAG: DHH family phosphoesterase [Bacilli bacterium]|nr:DHH family phosphoesterase [Bacilli bacterium]
MINTMKDLRNTLDSSIKKSSNVFIVGHNEPDFDAIGSAIGLQVYAKNIGKKAYIIVEDEDLEPGVKKIVEENREKFHIIKKRDFLRMRDKNSILIMTDVNKKYMISVGEELEDFKKIIVIDHHKPDKETVDTKELYINLETSSASEIVTKLLLNTKNIFFDSQVANYLLSGIVLDTHRFMKNTSASTHDIVEHLIKKGASTDYVNDLFLREFESDKKINHLVFNETMFRTFQNGVAENRNIAFSLNRTSPETIYRREELAKAADKLMKYRVDASFVLGYIKEGLISISARSRSDIDVSEIMSNIIGIEGGGNRTSAGGKSYSDNLVQVEKNIIDGTTEYLNAPRENEYVLRKVKKY